MTGMEIAMLCLLGGVLASFLYTTTERSLQGRSLWQRSACSGCQVPVSCIALVPIAGYLLSRGRCRSCNIPLARGYLYSELAGVGLALVLGMLRQDVSGAALDLFLILTALVIAMADIRTLKIPNALLVCMSIGIVLQSPVAPLPLTARLTGLLIGVALLALPALAYTLVSGRQGMGMGDIKYAGVLGLAVGSPAIVMLLAGALALAGAIAFIGLALGRLTRRSPLPLGAVMSLVYIIYNLFSPEWMIINV